MANKKILCPKCRRSYDNQIEYCPYCSATNPLFVESDKMKEDAPLAIPVRQKDSFKTQATDISEEYDDTEYDDGEYDDAEYDDEEYSDDEFNNNDEQYADDKCNISSDKEYDDDNEEYEQGDGYEVPSESDLSTESGRAKIAWTDKEEKETPDMSKAYNEDGGYEPNFDGFYNDTKPKIENELDNLASGRSKAILRIIATVAAIAGVILYLILTL